MRRPRLSVVPTVKEGSRKFTITLLVITLASLLVILEQLTGRQWVDIVGTTMIAYGAANVGEHFVGRKPNEPARRPEGE